MLIDQFTKWIECFPLPDQSAELVAKTIVDEFFTRMGTPLEIHSDKGSNFVSNLFSTLCVLLQITKTRTTSYRPCSNGQIERMNRQVLQMIRCLRDKNIRDWDSYLPHIAGAIRATVSRSPGFTPNKLMLGREVYKSADLLFGTDKANRVSKTPPEYVVHLEKVMKTSHKIARENLRSSVSYNKRDYDQRLYQTSYNTGDLVYVLDPSNKPGVSAKLQPIFRGPYLIIKVYSPVLYLVQDKKRKFVAHHDRLLVCNDRFIPMWMRKLRHQFLELDDTLPYDESELNAPEESVPSLFSSEPVKAQAPVPFSSDTSVLSQSDRLVADSDTDDDSRVADGENGIQPVTRRGRKVNLPGHLRDFILDSSD